MASPCRFIPEKPCVVGNSSTDRAPISPLSESAVNQTADLRRRPKTGEHLEELNQSDFGWAIDTRKYKYRRLAPHP